MANYVLQLSHFRYRGNSSRSDVNFNVSGKLPDIKNPPFGATSLLSFALTKF